MNSGRAGMGELNSGQHRRSEAPWGRVSANSVFSPARLRQLVAFSSRVGGAQPWLRGCSRVASLPGRPDGSPLAELRPLQAQTEGAGLRPLQGPGSSVGPCLLRKVSGVILGTYQRLHNFLNHSCIPRWTQNAAALSLFSKSL